MKPRWRSEWMRPAASGAVAPRWTSQALVSSSPVVRKVIRSRSRQAAPTTWSRPPRSTPYPRSRSAASSGGSSAASASRAAATATVGRPSLASTSAARSAAAAASASARLSTARAGLRVRGAKFRSTLASSGSQWAVRRGVPWSSRSRARARTSASRAASFTPALAFLAAFSAPPPIDSRSATVSSRVSSAAASTGSGALSSQAARTMARASASRRAPSPWADRPPPADSPATSTKRAATFTRLRERSSSDRTSTRGSGTGTAATLASPAAPPAGTPARVSALKRVVLPLWGSPTMPTSLMGKAYRFGVHPRSRAADRATMQTAITRTSGPGRVLLVDDHPAVRRVLRSLLEEVGGWQVVGEADFGEAAIPLVEQLAPDVVLMDCRSPVLRAEGVMATDLVAEVVDDWRLAEPDRRVELSLPDRPRSLQGDAEALRMVVGNLVDNAGKHAPPGTPISVEVSQSAGLTRIEVADRGEGVAEIDRERIFAPFTQLDASTTRRVGGVGLGLFLVDRLVRGMGGRVWVDETPGGGATFMVEIPDAEAPGLPPAQQPEA